MHREFNRRCPNALQFEQEYLFGFAYFRQVKDASIRRGYYQKSVILLSKLPLITLFNQAVSVIARKFFDGGEIALEASCHDLDRWPLPIPGHALELPLMGNVFQIHLASVHQGFVLTPDTWFKFLGKFLWPMPLLLTNCSL